MSSDVLTLVAYEGADRLGASGPNAGSVPEILELHLTRDDIVLRNGLPPHCG